MSSVRRSNKYEAQWQTNREQCWKSKMKTNDGDGFRKTIYDS